MGEDELGAAGVEFSRRKFVQRMLGVAFVAPVVASFTFDSLASAAPSQITGNQTCGNQGAPVSVHITANVLVGEGRIAHIPVTLSQPAPYPIAVDFETVDGTGAFGASSPEDYLDTSGTLFFAPGDQVKFIDVQTVRDHKFELPERFQVVLSTSTPCVSFTRDTSTVTIGQTL